MVDLHKNCQGKGFFAMAVPGHHTSPNGTWFFAFSSGLLDWIVLIMKVLKDLFTLHS